jgi:hypothetical protein
MREIKQPFVNKKTDKSMFLDKMYGGNRKEIITMDHIRRNIKFLFRDIARGSVSNPKFEEVLKSDTRIFQYALDMLAFDIRKAHVILLGIKIAGPELYTQSGDFGLVNEVANETNAKMVMYQIMYNGITNYIQTGDFTQIRSIGMTLNNSFNRKYQSVFF